MIDGLGNKRTTSHDYLHRQHHHHQPLLPPPPPPHTHINQPTDNMGLFRQVSRNKFYLFLLASAFLYLVYFNFPCDNGPRDTMVPRDKVKFMHDAQNRQIPYHEDMPLIFVGGMPRSGTTLMRAMLDAHPDIRCGEETRIIPRLLGMRAQWEKSAVEKKRLNEAGVTSEVIDSAVKAFILEVIAKHGPAATHLCDKDPFTLKSSVYLSKMFPNSKYVLMIRDGRAVVHSIISRKVTITGFDLKSYRQCLTKWNTALEHMYTQCLQVGSRRCLPVYYEQLALHPKEWMVRIVNFLELPWNDSVLHHEEYVGKPGGIALSRVEKSTDQVIKPVNVDALSKWVGHIPDDVVRDMPSIAPMLNILGYDPRANPPNYGKPDPMVSDNTLHIKRNTDFWKKRVDNVMAGAPDMRPLNKQRPPPPPPAGAGGGGKQSPQDNAAQKPPPPPAPKNVQHMKQEQVAPPHPNGVAMRHQQGVDSNNDNNNNNNNNVNNLEQFIDVDSNNNNIKNNKPAEDSVQR